MQAAIGGVADIANLIGTNGKVISFGGAPHLGFSVDPTQARFNSLSLVDGKWPGPDEVVIDQSTAKKKHIEVGDPIRIEAQGSAQPFKVSGLVKFGTSNIDLGGATLAGFDLQSAQHLFRKDGKLDQIRVSKKAGVSEAKLLSEIRSILPPQTQVRSGVSQAETDASDTNAFTSFLQKFLLSFGIIALFVGSFVIANSLSITVTQRTREFATLRTLGASRKQIRRSVLLESFIMGFLASAVGLFLGLGLAKLLFWLFGVVGLHAPEHGPAVQAADGDRLPRRRDAVTMLASLRPGAAGNPGAADRGRPRGRDAAAGALRQVPRGRLGDARDARLRPLAYGMWGARGTGAGAAVHGHRRGARSSSASRCSRSQLIRPLASVLGIPGDRLAGAPGILARENAIRNPQRTGSSAAALMIGLTLVTLVTMLATSIRASFFGAVDKIFIADYAVTAQNNFDLIPAAIGQSAAADARRAATSSASGSATRGSTGRKHTLSAVDPGGSKIFKIDWSRRLARACSTRSARTTRSPTRTTRRSTT